MTSYKGRTAFMSNKDVKGAGTVFKGRGGFPEGTLKRYPGGAADTDDSNRRVAKSNMGDGGGSGTRFQSRTAFGSKK